jgi:hypothetical protein
MKCVFEHVVRNPTLSLLSLLTYAQRLANHTV